MTPYVINSAHGQAVYDLLSVSNHYGGMGGGHCKLNYTTLAVQIALWQSVISFTKITYHTAKIFHEISGKNNKVFLFLNQLIR